jgi:cytosine permease
MSNGTLPSYLSMAKPNPAEERAPWYKGTAPVYAGIFLWVVFYMEIANGTLSQAGLGLSLLGLVIAALICHYLFYLVPGLLGMKTGYPLYVVGSSTYGTKGGFLMPGLLMGLLQFGWLAVNTAIATDFILQATGRESAVSIVDGALVFNGSAAFTVIAIIWAAVAVFMAIKGIQYIGKVSTYLPIVPLVMILIVFFSTFLLRQVPPVWTLAWVTATPKMSSLVDLWGLLWLLLLPAVYRLLPLPARMVPILS